MSISSSLSSSTTISVGHASSMSESVGSIISKNGLSFRELLFRIAIWTCSNFAPDAQALSSLKQWINKWSSLPSTGKFQPLILNDFLTFFFDRAPQDSNTHSIILRLGTDFIFPAAINSWSPSLSHLSYRSATFTLNGLFQQTCGDCTYLVQPPGIKVVSV